MPPTNYIWMRTNMNDELIGVYEWLNGAWHRIKFGGDSDYRDVYSKTEVDYLLQWTEQEIIRKLLEGEYVIEDFIIDDCLSEESKNAVQNKVITAELQGKLDKTEFDAFKENIPSLAGISYGDREYWNNQIGYVPKAGEIIIYSDYKTKEVDGQTVAIPGVKIGQSSGYVQDLPFVGEDLADTIWNHILDTMMHVTPQEKHRWNNKLNVDDYAEVINGSLTFNRN
jgi:hypothetical protein